VPGGSAVNRCPVTTRRPDVGISCPSRRGTSSTSRRARRRTPISARRSTDLRACSGDCTRRCHDHAHLGCTSGQRG
jgi:hypothetical protein